MIYLFLLILIPIILAKELTIKYGDKDNSFSSLKYENAAKNYEYSYLTSKEASKFESGQHVLNNDGAEHLEVKGAYYIEGNNGFGYQNVYTADKNGFVSQVFFGTNYKPGADVQIDIRTHIAQGKGIDSVLLCSLVGSGCR